MCVVSPALHKTLLLLTQERFLLRKLDCRGGRKDLCKIEFTDTKISQSLNDVSIGDIAYYLSNDLPEFNGNFVLSNVGFITKDKTKKCNIRF